MEEVELTGAPNRSETELSKYEKIRRKETKHFLELIGNAQAGLITAENQMAVIAPFVDRIIEMQRRIDQLQLDSLLKEYGFYNKGHFEELLKETVAKINSNPEPRQPDQPFHGAALLTFDFDHFKKANDTYGHRWGDQVIRHVASIIRKHVKREKDILGQNIILDEDENEDENHIGRPGGDETAAILYDTDRFGAIHVAETIRNDLMQISLKTPSGQDWYQTVSIGITLIKPGYSVEEIIDQADAAAYQAKFRGRNQTVIWEPGMTMPNKSAA